MKMIMAFTQSEQYQNEFEIGGSTSKLLILIVQILREINFGHFEAPKIAIFDYLSSPES